MPPLVASMLGAVSQGILWGIMALGVYITFKILDFADMTVDGSFALGGCSCAILISGGMNPLLALVVAIFAGMIAGAITGLLHTKLNIPGILAGILMQLALYSINLRVLGGPNKPLARADKTIMTFIGDIFGFAKKFRDMASTWTSLIAGLIFVVAVIVALYWFFGTEIGSSIRATGNNARMSRAQGINTDNMKLLALMISNGLVALSGGLVMQQQRFGDVSMGIGTIVIGLASIIIGEVFFGQKFSFWVQLLGVVIGSVIYRLIIAVVLQLGMKTQDMKLFSAIIVAFALSLPVLKKKIAWKNSASWVTPSFASTKSSNGKSSGPSLTKLAAKNPRAPADVRPMTASSCSRFSSFSESTTSATTRLNSRSTTASPSCVSWGWTFTTASPTPRPSGLSATLSPKPMLSGNCSTPSTSSSPMPTS